ncbi:MAG: hypothetical protein Q9187_008550, partial [Circinaria calcarea]
TPLKPPKWSDDSGGIQLYETPLCKYCHEDWRYAENLAEHSATPRSSEEEQINDATVNLKRKRSMLRRMSVSDDGSAGTGNVIDEAQILHYGKHESVPSHRTEQPSKLRKAVVKDDNMPELKRTSGAFQVEITTNQKPAMDRDSIERPTHVSIFRPLDPNDSYSPSKPRPLPKWMTMLPSNRAKKTPHTPKWMAHLPSNRVTSNHHSHHPLLPANLPSQFHSELPVQSQPQDSINDQESIPTPSEHCSTPPPACTFPPNRSPAPTTSTLTEFTRLSRSFTTPLPRTAQSSPFPYFQNPRAPLTPAAESSWSGNTPSPGLTPYAGLQYTTVPAKATFGRGQGMPPGGDLCQEENPWSTGQIFPN